VQEGSKASQLKRYATAVLGSGNIKQAVILPEGEDLNEWLAVNSTLPPPPPIMDTTNGIAGRLAGCLLIVMVWLYSAANGS